MERHDLFHEFPQHQEKVRQLKKEDVHFRELFDLYNTVENQIHKINIGEEVVIDEFAHQLKAKLLHIKDEIYSYLDK